MLSKINRIKRLGLVFADFTWAPAVPAFRAFNLVYGWNGCGKTTLTRLFDALATAEAGSAEFEVQDATEQTFHQGDLFPAPIRVFNQDYIQKNVRILETSANSISVLLGEQNKDLVAQIEADERVLNGNPDDPNDIGKLRELHGYTEKKSRKVRGNETAFTDIAKTIGAAIVGSGAAARNYRSPDAKKDFAAIVAPALLNDEDREKHILAIRQELLPELDPVAVPNRQPEDIPALAAADRALLRAKELCASTVESEAIRRFTDYPEIGEWVEAGLELHQQHGLTSCEFCGNAISQQRLAQLARHFSDTDRALKAEIDLVLDVLQDVHAAVLNLTTPDVARFYAELRKPYEVACVALTTAKEKLLAQLADVCGALLEKKLRTSDSVALDLTLDTDALSVVLLETNNVITAHNGKTQNFQTVQRKSVDAIKKHFLSTIYEDVSRRNKEIAELELDLAQRETAITQIQLRIAVARAKISSAHAACEQINEGIATFLGRDELRFEPETKNVANEAGKPTETVVGYRIMRGDQPAVYLSEGEKTALAFVYFVVHLNDGQFPKKDGIVVVDDPISSLDANSLYQAFSFLKNAVLGCHQVFVLTHNFDFLKLLLNWRKYAGGAGYYMIKNHFQGDERRASIVDMDRELKNYESEYHYLFKRLKEMRAEQDGSIMRAYPVPNIARKVWDTFLMFRVPSDASQYQKMEQLKKEGYSAQKLDAIYKFTNSQSHITGGGFDPALVPETLKVLGELFEMMEAIAPDHFAILDRATQIGPAVAAQAVPAE